MHTNEDVCVRIFGVSCASSWQCLCAGWVPPGEIPMQSALQAAHHPCVPVSNTRDMIQVADSVLPIHLLIAVQ